MRIGVLFTQLFAAVLVTMSGLAQARTGQIQILKLEVPPGLTAGGAAFPADAVRMEASANGFPEAAEASVVLQIRRAGQVLCGNSPGTGIAVRLAKQMQFDVAALAPALTACGPLGPGTYSLCARFYGRDGVPLSEEMCSGFQVSEQAPVTEYAAPVNLGPADRSFELEDAFRSGIRFSWKPVTPGYPGPVTYRLRVWNIPEGKDAPAAIRDGQPLLTRDIPDAAEMTLINALPLPAPGRTAWFAWTVQALNALGQPVGKNGGTSGPTTFASTTYAIRLDKISVSCTTTPGVYTFSFSLTNPNLGPAKLSALPATGSLPAGAAVASFTPPLNTTIPAGAQLTVTGSISASPGLSSICIGAQITDLGNSFWQASKDTCIPVRPCKCEACDPKKVNIQTPAATVVVSANNTLSLAQPVSVVTTPAKLVKSVHAELVYFAFTPDDDDCMPCNRDSRSFGNFLAGSLGPLAGTGSGTHSLDWTFAPPKAGTGITPFNATVSLPPLVRCCDANLRFCVRYVVTFADCTVCNKMVCYEKRLDGCSGGTPSTSNN